MARWASDSRGRLEVAALALFSERGFDDTTVAEIATRAGLTERTFFRHFADKREVLFGGASALQALLVAAVADAPDEATPIGAVRLAMQAAGALLQERREYSKQRQAIIVSTPELLERELIKLATLSAAIASALSDRGVAEPAASLAAETGVAVLKISFTAWVDDACHRELTTVLRHTFDELRFVAEGDASQRA